MLVIDIECNPFPSPNPFHKEGKLVCIGLYDGVNNGVYPVTPSNIAFIQGCVDSADEIVGFNLKFDLNWLRRIGIICTHKRGWDCQVAEFLFSNQIAAYNSLEQASQKYLGEGKDDTVDREYWSQGINSDQIPTEVLYKYCLKDCELTWKVAAKQKELVTPERRVLFSLTMQDLLVLHEMEYNGMHFNREGAWAFKEEAENEIESIIQDVGSPCPAFNWNSGEHLSALLYGGTVNEERRIPVGLYKTGAKQGEPRYKIEKFTHHLPRKYKPIKGTELVKPGIWSVEEEVLLKLGGGDLVKRIIEIKEREGLISKYYNKLPTLQVKNGWDFNYLHGTFNQCVARTGRLSSKDPNLQNFAKKPAKLLTSRYSTRSTMS